VTFRPPSALNSHKLALARYAEKIHHIRENIFEETVDMGELLTDARAACREIGIGWYDWLAPTGLSPDTAERLMTFSKFIRSLAPDQVDVVSKNISLKAFLLLAAPSTATETRKEILQRAEQGERIHSGVVRRSRRGARPFPTQT
jgi:hypothetical protein